MKKKLLTISYLLFFSLSVFSQDDSGVIIYEPFDDTEELNKEDVPGYNHAIKWDLGVLTRGAFVMEFERVLSDYFTIMIGAGPAYIDYWYLIINDDDFLDNENEIKPGFVLELSTRIYPNTVKYFDGFYFSPLFRIRDYNSTTTYKDSYQNTSGDYIETNKTYDSSISFTEYGLILGFQSEGFYYDLLWDYWIGVGLRNKKTNILDYNSNGSRSVTENKSFTPFLWIGVSLGFPF